MEAARATRGEHAGALAWSLQPVAVMLALPAVPPLLQATLATTVSLLLLWLWTRWRDIGVFAQDATLAPGLRLGLLFSARMAFLYAAVAHLGAAGAVACGAAVVLLAEPLRSGLRAWASALLAGLALLLLARYLEAFGWLLAVLSGLAWATQEWVAADPRLQGCAGERCAVYQLIGAAVTLPVASVVAGENWLVEPAAAAWWALGLQVAACLLAVALLWIVPAPQRRASRLPTLLAVAPTATLLLQQALARPAPAVAWVAAALLLAAARWPRSGERLSPASE